MSAVIQEQQQPLQEKQRRPLVPYLVAAVVVALVAAAAVMAAETRSWANAIAGEERLLPGTTIASTDVSGMTVDEARAVAQSAADEAVARTVTVAYADDQWTVTPAELGAATDVDDILAAAQATTASASWVDLGRIRWLGGTVSFDSQVSVAAPDAAVADYVDTLASEIDRDPVDAGIEWSDGDVVATGDEIGLRLDQEGATADLSAALAGAADDVDLVVEELAPAVTDAMVEPVFPALKDAVDAALDREVAAQHDDRSWTVTPRELGAAPVLPPLVESALAASGGDEAQPVTDGDELEVALDVPDDGIAAFLEPISGELDQSARNASVDYSTGWVEIRGERAGRAVDRDGAAERLREAITDKGESFELPVSRVEPEVTTASLRHVLLVRQNERKLYLYRDGERVREWSVAVGASGHDTPTGVFTVGAKRHMPTWHNPDPNGWGRDMPAVIQPGPNNPLGLRALNWNQNGRDTLIRFHGTPNASSIGTAASKGCIRLTNSDIVDLYDLVPSGATIVSIRA